jgi:hypothetical protein
MKYITRPDWFMRSDIHNAPVGKKLLLINQNGFLVQGVQQCERLIKKRHAVFFNS